MASKSASGRRRMQKVVQKSQIASNKTFRPSSPTPTRSTPPRRSPSPLFFQPPRSRTPQPSPLSSRANAPSPTLRRAEPRTTSPMPSQQHHSADAYPTPPTSSGNMSLPLHATSFASDLIVPSAPGPNKQSKNFIAPSPSRRGNPNPRSTHPPSPLMGKRKSRKRVEANGSSTEGGAPSRFRLLLSREKKGKASIDSSLPPRPPHPAKDSIRLRHSVSQQDHFSEERFLAKDVWVRKHEMRLHPYQSSAPYPVAFDYDALESERSATVLLKRLNPHGSLSPSFHDYGHHPPLSVLDLGCGAGYWVKNAASAWKSCGTMVTGFDMVDVTKGVLDFDSEDAHYSFVRGNFLTKKLPFMNESFDLVRMANLSLCIPYDKWDFVLGEVNRVLTLGGRLEVIDDEIIFPYATPLSRPPTSSPRMSFLTFSDSSILVSSDVEPSLSDESDLCNARTSSESTPTPTNRFSKTPSVASDTSPHSDITDGKLDFHDWVRQASSSREMETLFNSMLSTRLHIHPRPCEFLLDAIKGVFGRRNSTLLRTMDLKLAHPDMQQMHSTQYPTRLRENDTFTLRPGLILAPDTLVTMPPDEMARHAYRHIDTLLGCKSAVADYVELREEDEVRVVDEEFWEAWWDYESFTRHRFDLIVDPDHPPRSIPDEISRAESITESTEEYQSLFFQRFDWDQESNVSVLGNEHVSTALFRPASPGSSFSNHAESPVGDNSTSASHGEELIHVRTIRIYEGTKVSNRTFPF